MFEAKIEESERPAVSGKGRQSPGIEPRTQARCPGFDSLFTFLNFGLKHLFISRHKAHDKHKALHNHVSPNIPYIFPMQNHGITEYFGIYYAMGRYKTPPC